MRNRVSRIFQVFSLFMLCASAALAIPAQWMPGFPMRMGTNVMLMWTPVPGATGYNVYRSGKEGDPGKLLIASPMNNYMDVNVPSDQSVFYIVKYVLGGIEANDPSSVGKLFGLKPLDPPKWIGHMDGEGQVSLRLEAVTGAAFYNIFRAENKDGPFTLMGSVQEAKYVDTTVKEEVQYYYQASAVDKNNTESPKSVAYEYKIPKKIVSVQAKGWKQIDKLVTVVDDIYGPDSRPLNQPTWLVTDGTYLVVGDMKGIVVMERDGTLVLDLKPPANYQGTWGILRGVGITADGLILAAFARPSIVRAITTEGAVAFEIPVNKPDASEYAGREKDSAEDVDFEPAPRGVTEDPAGNIWVTEATFGQVHIYNRGGKLLGKIGKPKIRGFEDEAMKAISMVVYHKPTNRMYVVDPTVGFIRAFDVATMTWIKGPDGKPFFGWSRMGNGVGYIQEVRGFDVMKDGSLLITDGIDGRLQVFAPDMDYLGTIVDEPGKPKVGGLGAPMGTVAIENRLYIAAPLAQKILILEMK